MNLKEKISEYPDFPKKDILFRDFSPLLKDPSALSFVVEEFSKQDLEDYGFSMTYRGTYNFMGRVESALFASADMGWAALRQSQHWQIWVIRPSLSFLKSPWMTSTQEALEWLKKHSREFIRTDEELKIIIPVLEAHNEIPTTLSAQEQLSLLRKETANFESQLEAIIQEKIQPVTPSSNSSTVTATRPRPSFRQNSPSVANINKAKPVALKDFNLDGLLCRLERVDPKLYPSLYRVELHDEINQNIKIDWLYLKAENDEQPHWGLSLIHI